MTRTVACVGMAIVAAGVLAQSSATTLAQSGAVPYQARRDGETVVLVRAMVIDSSHTLPGAFGYLLTQITTRPRLVVATHFPTADDTVECTLNIVRKYAGSLRLGDDIIWSWDLMTLSVTGSGIVKRRGRIDEFTYTPIGYMEPNQKPPKYAKWSTNANGKPIIAGDPRAQLDTSTVIEPGPNTYCSNGY